MTLDHDSGDMDGEVREGRYRGRTLSSLSLEEIVELWREYALRDEQSRTVLESYMDRTYSDWREAAGDDTSRSGRQDKGG
ncbi:MAG: molecular chaperone DnaJ, partial [Alphaproteobacteria bacterium]